MVRGNSIGLPIDDQCFVLGTSMLVVQDIVWHRRTGRRKRPANLVIALSGWTDAGDAATIATNTLIEQLRLRPLAHLDPEPYYDFSMVRPHIKVSESGVSELRWNTLVFNSGKSGSKAPLFVGLGPEPQFHWRTATEQILQLADYLAVETIITMGSLLAAAPHTKPPKVFGYASNPYLAKAMDLESPEYDGPTGFLSVLQSAARVQGFEIVALWAEVPHYLSQFPAQRSAMALIDRIEIALDLDLELASKLAVGLEEIDKDVQEFVLRDPELIAYVKSLEETWEQEATVKTSMDNIAAEVERYLRRHRNA
jgi:proteasome assembly chaperone (PAC2) family protein